jgi:hypothetical protein
MRKADHRRHWARRTLLWGLGLFLAAQLGGSLLLDYAGKDLRFPSAARVLRCLRQRPAPQVVFFGSSRFAPLFPKEMERLLAWSAPTTRPPVGVFNAAVPGGDLITTEHLLRRLLNAGAHPRLVVVEVMPEYFSCHNYWYGHHACRQLRWEDLREHGADIIESNQAGRFLSARLFGLYIHRAAVRKALLGLAGQTSAPTAEPPAAPPPAGPIDWDQILRPPHLDMTPTLAALLATGQGPQVLLRHYHFGGGNVRALERLLLLCREQGIEVLLLTPPTTGMYRGGYPPEVEADYHSHLAGLQKRFGCRFLDCRDWLEDNLFQDSHHLRNEGGLYFSCLFAHRVLIPWQLQQSANPLVTAALSGLEGDGPARPPDSCK